MLGEGDLPGFDPNVSGRRARLAAAVCVALVVSAFIILVSDVRGTESCPYWRVRDPSGGHVPIWIFLAITSPAAAWSVYIAIDWKRFARKIYENAADLEKEAEAGSLRTRLGGFDQFPPRFFPHDDVLRLVLIGWCGFCAIPLFAIFYGCTGWFGM